MAWGTGALEIRDIRFVLPKFSFIPHPAIVQINTSTQACMHGARHHRSSSKTPAPAPRDTAATVRTTSVLPFNHCCCRSLYPIYTAIPYTGSVPPLNHQCCSAVYPYVLVIYLYPPSEPLLLRTYPTGYNNSSNNKFIIVGLSPRT